MLQIKESLIIFVLSIVILINLYDLWLDISHNAADWHLFVEIFLIFISTITLLWLALSLRLQRRELAQLKQEINQKSRVVSSAPKVQAIRHQLSEVIQEQFTDWQLTVSEQEVALFLLKGLSFKEISAVRNTLEKTVRQQASTIYKKAGLSGRHEFSAWFIEDFL